MEIKITGIEDRRVPINDTITENGTARNAQGGTELMRKALYEKVDNDLLNDVNLISSRVRYLSEDKPNILWCHDTWNDPEVAKLKDPKYQDNFAAFVFVSNYQMGTYQTAFNLSHDKCIVLKNAIEPIPYKEKEKDGPLKFIYHTTPHRGLDILVSSFDVLYKEFGDAIELDVFSSFEAYGWKERDEQYKGLFDFCEDHAGINYHGFQPNNVVREALQNSHIFAYPNTWPETSCIAAIEALSARNAMSCPTYYALPETTSGFAFEYQLVNDKQKHANIFINYALMMFQNYWNPMMQERLGVQKYHIDNNYNWDVRAEEWTNFLTNLKKS